MTALGLALDSAATERLFSWGRYLYWSELMRRNWDKYMTEHTKEETQIPDWLCVTAYCGASLYVVIEGWESAQLTDPIIDALLQRETFKDTLRKLRNSTFHFQASLTSQKFIEFLSSDDATLWQITLHDEFCRFFREWVDGFGVTPEQQAELREKAAHIVGWIPTTSAGQAIESLYEHVAEELLSSPDAESNPESDSLRAATDNLHAGIRESRQLARLDRLERLSKLGIKIIPPSDKKIN